MKYIKTLGLAVVAAMAVMAFAGASSASATVLCKTEPNGNDCAPTWEYMTKQKIEASAKGSVSFEETTGNPIITCTNGGLKGEITSSGSGTSTATGVMEEFTVAGCSASVGIPAFGTFEIHANDSDEATVTGKGLEITLNTSLTGSCFFGSSGTIPLGSMKGGEAATLTVNANFVKLAGGFLCPASMRWTATYTVTSPKGMHFATTTG